MLWEYGGIGVGIIGSRGIKKTQGRARNVALRVFKEGSQVHKYSPDWEAVEA